MRRFAMLGVMFVTFTSWAASVSAVVVTVYTDKTEWENALGGQFLTEDFNDSQLNDGVSFVSTESGHINPAEGYYQDVLASQSQNEPMTTWTFAPEIFGYGGNWTLGGPGGSGNSLLVSIADSSLYVGSISNSYNGGFWGFISDTPFTSVQLVGGGGTNQQNYRLDNMVYSQATMTTGYSLTVDINDENKGTVSIDPEQPSYAPGTPVTLTGTPFEGKVFGQWEIYHDPNHAGDANYVVIDANNPTTILMDSDKHVRAVFNCSSGVGPMLPMMLTVLGLFVVVRQRR